MQYDEVVDEVNKVNAEFYHAFESLSIEMMDKLWKHDEQYRDDKVYNYKYKSETL